MGKRKERSPEEQEGWAKIRELMQLSGVSSMDDIQELFKETIAEFMENGLEAELSEELGYSKYDYKHKETENSRNGQIVRFEVTNKSLSTGVSITKTGPKQIMAGQPVRYVFSDIANNSNVMLTSFCWRECALFLENLCRNTQ